MRLTILVIGLLLTANATAADIYQWTDAQGRVHFGDRPQAARPARGRRRSPM